MDKVMNSVCSALTASLLLLAGTSEGTAGTCEAKVVGVSGISNYNRATGSGFLAVRSGPGSDYTQIGEVYLGDWNLVFEKHGNWYRIGCYEGRCSDPFWGPAKIEGWAYGRYLSVGGLCDHLK